MQCIIHAGVMSPSKLPGSTVAPTMIRPLALGTIYVSCANTTRDSTGGAFCGMRSKKLCPLPEEVTHPSPVLDSDGLRRVHFAVGKVHPPADAPLISRDDTSHSGPKCILTPAPTHAAWRVQVSLRASTLTSSRNRRR